MVLRRIGVDGLASTQWVERKKRLLEKDMTEIPLVVVVLMVKNEASSIQATLASYHEGGLRHFFVFDTGSTDDTVSLTQDFFKQHSSVAHIEEEPFIDFSQSRNRALALAESTFPNAVFFIMPDAEWYLQHPKRLLAFCEKEQHQDTPLYIINTKMNETEFTTARLFRAKRQIRFEGVVHEVPDTLATVKVPDPVRFDVISTEQGVAKSTQRWEQDLILLTQEFEKNPQHSRTAFYLGQTYECLGRKEEAFQIYQHRATLNGWDEENFTTFLRLGYLADLLSQQDSSKFNWDLAANYYLNAFALRPHRIEPLVKLAEHYWPDNAAACYLYIKHTYDLPYPHQDQLFIERRMYDYDRYEIMSRCAWYLGDYELGKDATLKALVARPDTPHLLRNLGLYQQKLETIV